MMRAITRSTRSSLKLAIVCMTALSVLTAASPAVAGDLEDRGRALLDARCGQCHAVGATGDSALAKAPAFRHLGRKYKLETLAEPLAEGIVTGHPDMPEATFKAEEIEAILAYLTAIAEP
ncbi:MAG TPA: cytochrome c [Hyphomicrobiaceae bacterium]|nr:cytochrome c [Hyphomicrobiaceae bacterium]